MKRLFLLAAMCAAMLLNKASAQEKLPDFVIADVKGQYHKIDQPAFKKQVLLIYFLPDCDDCRAFTAKLVNNKHLFDQYHVIMVTNADLKSLKRFVEDFRLTGIKDLTIGTEGWTATLLRSVHATHFPYVAVYSATKLPLRTFAKPDELF